MNGDRDLERTLVRWLAAGPARMPDAFFDAVIDRVDRTPQRRLAGLAKRYLNMPANIRFTAVAAMVAVAVIAVGLWALFAPSRTSVGNGGDSSPRPSATMASTPPSASPTASPAPIADGTYALAPMQVADLVAMIQADTKLTAAEKTFLIDDAFAIKGARTFTVSLVFSRGRFVEQQAVDARVDIGTQGTFTIPDERTLILNEDCACPPTTLRLSVNGDSFSLQLVNPPTKEVDLIPAQVLFESGPFVRQR